MQATNATDDEPGMAILQQWEDEFELSRIPVLAVGSQEAFDGWDLDGACPSVYVLGPDMTVLESDGPSADLGALEGLLPGVR